MGIRGTIASFIIAAMAFLVIYYFMNDGDLTNWFEKNNNNSEKVTPSCRDACIDDGYFKGECIKGDSTLKSQNVCTDRNWVDLGDRSLKLSDCDFKAFAAWEVCCCYNE